MRAQLVPVDGNEGLAGNLRIYISEPNGHLIGPYTSPFKHNIKSFDFVDSNEDQILEYGEEVTLHNFVVENLGKLSFDMFLND